MTTRVVLPISVKMLLRWTSNPALVFLFDSRVCSNNLFFSGLTMCPRGGQISIPQDVATESQSFFTLISGTPSRHPAQIGTEYRWARRDFVTPPPLKPFSPGVAVFDKTETWSGPNLFRLGGRWAKSVRLGVSWLIGQDLQPQLWRSWWKLIFGFFYFNGVVI